MWRFSLLRALCDRLVDFSLLKRSLMIVHLETEQLGKAFGSEYIVEDYRERNGKDIASSIHI